MTFSFSFGFGGQRRATDLILYIFSAKVKIQEFSGMGYTSRMQKFAVIFFGTPGSGKGMQADLLAEKYSLIHFDSGKVLRGILYDPGAQKDPVIARERKLNDGGILNTPSWVLGIFKKRAREISKSGYGIVYSGSPRTLYEAEGLLPVLEKEYGRENIFIFFFKVPPEMAAKRNADRYVCTFCKRPLLTAYYPSKHPTNCPVCAAPLERRKDDDPGKYKVRYQEYVTRTKPVIDFVKRRGYRVDTIDGTPAPYVVFQKIQKRLPKR